MDQEMARPAGETSPADADGAPARQPRFGSGTPACGRCGGFHTQRQRCPMDPAPEPPPPAITDVSPPVPDASPPVPVTAAASVHAAAPRYTFSTGPTDGSVAPPAWRSTAR